MCKSYRQQQPSTSSGLSIWKDYLVLWNLWENLQNHTSHLSASSKIVIFFLLICIAGFNTSENSSFLYFKAIVIAVSPFIILFFLSQLIMVRKLIKNVSSIEVKRELITCVLIILYLVHPSITKYALSLFYCVELDPGEYWLYRDLQIRCWTGDHMLWALAIGIPMILVWVIGAPLVGIIILTKHRRHLNDPIFFSRFRMIYQGLKTKFFFWEFVNIGRKMFLVSTNVFMSTFDDIFKALLSLLVLVLIFRVKEKVCPYKNPVLNYLESRENMASIITFFGALFYLNAEISETVHLIVFLVIIFANLWFFVVWAYAILKTYRRFRAAICLSKLIARFVIPKYLLLEEIEFRKRNDIKIAKTLRKHEELEKEYA